MIAFYRLFLWIWSLALLVRAENDGVQQQQMPEEEGMDTTQTRQLQAYGSEAPNFYDSLRFSNGVFVQEGDPGSNLYTVTTASGTFRMAHFQFFLPLSNGTHVSGLLDQAYPALMAIYHLNNIAQSPILRNHPDIRDCSVSYTADLYDSRMSPVETTRTFTSLTQRPSTFQEPPATGVVGAFESSVSSALAILSGINNVPQISGASTAVEFDVKEQFPLFGRTVTNTEGIAAATVEFFKSIGSTHVAILFVTDSAGSALQKSFQDAASTADIQTESIAFSSEIAAGSDEANSVIAQLAKTRYQHVYHIYDVRHIGPLMSAQGAFDVLGPNYLHVFGALDVLRLVSDLKVAPGSPIAALFNGAGIVQMQGGVLDKPILPSEIATDTAPKFDETSSFGQFVESWRDGLSNKQFMDYVRSKFPSSLDTVDGFDRESVQISEYPGRFDSFLYDAAFSLGLAACRAGAKKTFFEAADVYSEFVELDYDGASGRVQILGGTGTRNYETISFVLWNGRVAEGTDSQGNALLGFYPALKLENGTWSEVNGEQFIFSDGTNNPPDSLPEVESDFNYVGKSGRIAGFILMSIVVVSAFASLIWLIMFRNEHVIQAAQPFFLTLVSVGAIVTSSAIIPLAMEETTTNFDRGLDIACMSTPWLYFVGINISFSALFSKMIGVHQAYLNPELEFISVSNKDILATASILLGVNVIILLVWTLVSPLEWTRKYKGTVDEFGRKTESYGECSGEDDFVYIIVLVAINLIFLVLGNVGAYQSRNIETEYNESRYVTISMFSVLQAWCMGIPILAVTYDNPQGRFYVMSGIIFVTAEAIIALVYVPKVIALRNQRKERLKSEDPKKEAYLAYYRRSEQTPKFEEEGEDADVDASPGVEEDDEVHEVEELADSSLPLAEETSATAITNELGDSGQGMKIVHNPKASKNLELSGGVELSKEQLAYVQEEDNRKSQRQSSRSPQSRPANGGLMKDPIQEEAKEDEDAVVRGTGDSDAKEAAATTEKDTPAAAASEE